MRIFKSNLRNLDKSKFIYKNLQNYLKNYLRNPRVYFEFYWRKKKITCVPQVPQVNFRHCIYLKLSSFPNKNKYTLSGNASIVIRFFPIACLLNPKLLFRRIITVSR